MDQPEIEVSLTEEQIGLLLLWMYRAGASGPAASMLINIFQNAQKLLRANGGPEEHV